MTTILTPKQMAEAEQASIKLGVSLGELMDNAGQAFGRELLSFALQENLRNIVILVGNGNNGGDGLVCANFLTESGIIPTVVLMCGKPKTELSVNAFESLHKSITVINEDSCNFTDVISNADIIADCIFGTGFHGEIKADLLEHFNVIGNSDAYKIACDCPSGVNCLNGQVADGTFRCIKTITFHRSKTGLHFHPAKDYCGDVIVKNIGIPDGWDKNMDTRIYLKPKHEIVPLLPHRSRNSHKGTFGRLMLICGSESYMGAAMISTKSSLKSGVGIAQLCTPTPVAHSLVSAMPECVFTLLAYDEQGFITADNASMLCDITKKCSAAVIGCGLGVTDGTKAVVYELIRNSQIPLIIDADGINCLSTHIDILEEKQAEIILTPHPAELARLCGVSTAEILENRLGYAVMLAKKYGVTIVSKATQTITALSDGTTFVTDFGNTALAKGGSGDMLAGLIGSFISQGVATQKACLLACCLMGCTAERLSAQYSERSILASDIISHFSQELKDWENK